MPPTRPPYPPEFKQEAVRLMRSSQKPLAQIFREIEVSEQTLRNWRLSKKRSIWVRTRRTHHRRAGGAWTPRVVPGAAEGRWRG